jgi:hypothetical protein
VTKRELQGLKLLLAFACFGLGLGLAGLSVEAFIWPAHDPFWLLGMLAAIFLLGSYLFVRWSM